MFKDQNVKETKKVLGLAMFKDKNVKATKKVFGLAMLEGLQATEHSLARSHY